MTSVTFTLNRAGFDHLINSPSGEYGMWLVRLGNSGVNKAKMKAPVDTGLLRSSISFRLVPTPEGLGAELSARTNYARYVEQGTRFMRGRHFLRDAAAEAVHEATR